MATAERERQCVPSAPSHGGAHRGSHGPLAPTAPQRSPAIPRPQRPEPPSKAPPSANHPLPLALGEGQPPPGQPPDHPPSKTPCSSGHRASPAPRGQPPVGNEGSCPCGAAQSLPGPALHSRRPPHLTQKQLRCWQTAVLNYSAIKAKISCQQPQPVINQGGLAKRVGAGVTRQIRGRPAEMLPPGQWDLSAFTGSFGHPKHCGCPKPWAGMGTPPASPVSPCVEEQAVPLWAGAGSQQHPRGQALLAAGGPSMHFWGARAPRSSPAPWHWAEQPVRSCRRAGPRLRSIFSSPKASSHTCPSSKHHHHPFKPLPQTRGAGGTWAGFTEESWNSPSQHHRWRRLLLPSGSCAFKPRCTPSISPQPLLSAVPAQSTVIWALRMISCLALSQDAVFPRRRGREQAARLLPARSSPGHHAGSDTSPTASAEPAPPAPLTAPQPHQACAKRSSYTLPAHKHSPYTLPEHEWSPCILPVHEGRSQIIPVNQHSPYTIPTNTASLCMKAAAMPSLWTYTAPTPPLHANEAPTTIPAHHCRPCTVPAGEHGPYILPAPECSPCTLPAHRHGPCSLSMRMGGCAHGWDGSRPPRLRPELPVPPVTPLSLSPSRPSPHQGETSPASKRLQI